MNVSADDLCLVYITTKNRDEALRIGRTLVDRRLAACANVLDPITSLYWWDGKIQQDQECVLIAKTRTELVRKLNEVVIELHSYDCPCVVTLPIGEGNPAYLHWLREQTRA